MSNIKFVVESYNPDGSVVQNKHKRIKHACLACQVRKVRCSGSLPCSLCQEKKLECLYKDSSHASSATSIKELTRKLKVKNGQRSAANQQGVKIDSTTTDGVDDISKFITSPAETVVKTTRQPYFRWLGPTAIAPPVDGTFRLLSVNLCSNYPEESKRSVTFQRQKDIQPRNANILSETKSDITEPEQSSNREHSTIPKVLLGPEIVLPLPKKETYEQFILHMTNYLPYLPWDEFRSRLERGVIGESCLFAIASLSERLKYINNSSFAGNDEQKGDLTMAETYGEAAKRLVLPHFASPSVEVVYTLLLISYCEFADDRDSGLWAWLGMAIRMCYDLGLHKAQTHQRSEDNIHKKVFWAVVCTDRLICCGTGRNVTIPDSDIEYELECGTIEKDGVSKSDPFPYFCRLMILLGKVSDYINTASQKVESGLNFSGSSGEVLSPGSFDAMQQFSQFQQMVSNFYNTLPDDLLFDVQHFQDYDRMNQSQIFLLLHLWNQALILAVHHPTLVYPKFKLDVAGLMSSPHAVLTGTGAISIADMIVFAELIDAKSFMANPHISQPIYMAASAALSLWHTLPESSPSHTIHTLKRTYNSCRRILDRMQKIWRGISWHKRTLDSLEASEQDVDLSTSMGYVFTQDLGTVRNASFDESTRQWLADEFESSNSDDIYGLFISGTIGDGGSSLSPQVLTDSDFMPS